MTLDACVVVSLTPIKEKEVWLLADAVGPALGDAIYRVLDCYLHQLGVTCFNVVLYVPPLAAVPEDWSGFPVIARIVDRGALHNKTADMGAMELYASSVVSSDPFQLVGYLRAAFAHHGYRARVIPNVVDASRFRYRERSPLRPRLLSTRNLESYYRIDNTLEAFALVRARHREATLTIAGSGSEEPRLRRLAASLGSHGIRFVGRVEPAAMADLCEQADIFVNSSVVDNQPVSVLEAFAAGLPVVSTPTGDLAALVRDGDTGLIVPAGDPPAMAKAVVSLLDHPECAQRMARRAHGTVEAYSWPRVREQWAAVYSGATA